MGNMKNPDAKQRLIGAMIDALQRRGLHGSGLTELLVAADAPKGVMYHHFPGGKTALAVAAIEATTTRVCDSLDAKLSGHSDPSAALMAWIGSAQTRLKGSGYEHGCPLATIALESTAADTAIRTALADAFAAIRLRIAAALLRSGYRQPGADALAALLVAAYEGALLQARVAADAAPMVLVNDALITILQSAAFKGEAT